MKKITALLLLLIVLSGCANIGKSASESKIEYGNMYIEEAKLLQKETELVALLSGKRMAHLFDYSVDDTINSIRVQFYKLDENGKWAEYGASQSGVSRKKGRIALIYGELGDPIEAVVQDASGKFSIAFEPDDFSGREGMSTAVSWLYQEQIGAEKEIPLAIQIITSGDTVYAYGVEEFSSPERYKDKDYDAVYAITVRFSEESLK